jgi:hypothetical protein
MKINSVCEFRDNASGLLRSLPIELKREVFPIFGDEMRRQVKKRGLSEDEIDEDFKSWRKTDRRR